MSNQPIRWTVKRNSAEAVLLVFALGTLFAVGTAVVQFIPWNILRLLGPVFVFAVLGGLRKRDEFFKGRDHPLTLVNTDLYIGNGPQRPLALLGARVALCPLKNPRGGAPLGTVLVIEDGVRAMRLIGYDYFPPQGFTGPEVASGDYWTDAPNFAAIVHGLWQASVRGAYRSHA